MNASMLLKKEDSFERHPQITRELISFNEVEHKQSLVSKSQSVDLPNILAQDNHVLLFRTHQIFKSPPKSPSLFWFYLYLPISSGKSLNKILDSKCTQEVLMYGFNKITKMERGLFCLLPVHDKHSLLKHF